MPNFRKLGKRVGKMMKEVKEACEKLTTEQIKEFAFLNQRPVETVGP